MLVMIMAHMEIHKINGKEYKYEVTNYRVGKKVKHKWKYLGPVNPLNSKERKYSGGRPPEYFIREITLEEKSLLEKSAKSTNAFVKDRSKILLLSAQKIPAKIIAEKTNCEVRKVRLAIKAFNKNGLNALQRGKAKGAKPKFTENIKKIILMHFSKQPKDFALHFTTWTLPRFRKHLIEYNVVDSISIERLRQILDAAGARLKRSKRWQYSPDKQFYKKKLQ